MAVCGWLLGAVLCPGQLTDSLGTLQVDLPVPPPSRVLDVAGTFDRHPEKLAEISGMLKALDDRHEVPVYLIVYAGLLRGGVTDHAKAFFDTWVGEGRDGLVLVCDTDSGELAMSSPLAAYAASGDGAVTVSRLPDAEMIPILMELKKMQAARKSEVDFLVEMTRYLTTRLDGVLSVQRGTGLDHGTGMIAGITLLVGGLLTLLGWLASRMMRGAEEKAREQFLFPDVLVGVRLGAQCGGGRVAVKSYGEDRAGGEGD